jgi:hypothetical protein
MILSVLILRKTGEDICARTYSSEVFETTLTSGFISAAFNFTQETFGAEIRDIELGPYKIMFEQCGNLIVAVLFEQVDSIIHIQNILDEIKNIMDSEYSEAQFEEHCSPDDYPFLDERIDRVISQYTISPFSESKMIQYKSILTKLRSKSEILDCDLISASGRPLRKDWNEDFLNLCIRLIDAFWKSKRYVLDQIIVSYQKRILILHKFNAEFVLSALIKRSTPVGMATYLIEETTNELMKVI